MIREARMRKTVKGREEKEKLYKIEARELKVVATLHKKNIAEEANMRHGEERKAKAYELAAARELKKQRRDAATSQKSRDTLHKDN
jgi:hypothetical protein